MFPLLLLRLLNYGYTPAEINAYKIPLKWWEENHTSSGQHRITCETKFGREGILFFTKTKDPTTGHHEWQLGVRQ